MRIIAIILITLGMASCGDSSNPPKADGPVTPAADTATVPKEASTTPSEASTPKDASLAPLLIGEWTGTLECGCVAAYQIHLIVEGAGKATANIDEGSVVSGCHPVRKFTAGNYTATGNQLTVKFTAATDTYTGCVVESMNRTDYVYTEKDLSDWDYFFTGTFTVNDKTLTIERSVGGTLTLSRKL